MSAGMVVIRYDARGDISYCATGDTRLIVIDERAARDRVCEVLSRVPLETVAVLIGDSPVGSSRDGRHEALAARIRNNGRPKLEIVKGGGSCR